jgi:YihY family inner membrane protein
MITPLRRLESLLFDPPAASLGRAGVALQWVLRYAYALVRDLVTGDLNMRAMSLVYTTLLSLVPLCAFSFSIVKGLGFHHDLGALLAEFFRPLGDRGDELTQRVLGFVDHMEGGVLGSLGLGFLIWTVVSVIQKVEDCFNHIWHVEQSRSFARRFSEYLGVLVIGPVLMVAAFGLIASLGSRASLAWLAGHQPLGAIVLMLGRLGPTLIVTAGFTFLYTFIPNTRVRLRVALAAGLAAAAAWVAAAAAAPISPLLAAKPKVDPKKAVKDKKAAAKAAAAPAAKGTERFRIGYRGVRVGDGPDDLRSTELGRLDRGDEVEILASHEGFLQVRTPAGLTGWIPRHTITGSPISSS